MFEHISVLLQEAINSLNIKENGIYVDATTGGAGHSAEILKRLKSGKLFCFDQDSYALSRAKERLEAIGTNFTLIKDNFVNIAKRLAEINIMKIDGIIYDLGVSSFQLDMAERGFSYHNDAPLDMRMDLENPLTAEIIVNEYSFNDLVRILTRYGEEPFAKQIARKIEAYRETKRIKTTLELVDIIKSALPSKILSKKGHPAKQTFQALRIAVNDELRVFETSIEQTLKLLNSEGRAVVITFHSLEDRICKDIFKELTTIPDVLGLPVMPVDNREYTLISKKPILPSDDELIENNRAHSAKMRVIEKK